MSDLVAYVDGGSHGNPGPAGIGVVIEDLAGERTRISKWIGQQDNNVAEYLALLEALQHAIAVKARSLRVYSDSQIVVKQMLGEYACRSARLHSLNWTCRKLARAFDFSIEHICRDENREANDLANHAVRLRTS
jgi:ribonuclease HI